MLEFTIESRSILWASSLGYFTTWWYRGSKKTDQLCSLELIQFWILVLCWWVILFNYLFYFWQRLLTSPYPEINPSHLPTYSTAVQYPSLTCFLLQTNTFKPNGSFLQHCDVLEVTLESWSMLFGHSCFGDLLILDTNDKNMFTHHFSNIEHFWGGSNRIVSLSISSSIYTWHRGVGTSSWHLHCHHHFIHDHHTLMLIILWCSSYFDAHHILMLIIFWWLS